MTTHRDVRGFLHVCCLGEYREVTWEIMHAILESGLYDRSVAIELSVLGTEAEQQVVETLIRPFERFRIAYRSSDVLDYEFPTLGLLQDACLTWNGPVYYVHTKGVSVRGRSAGAGPMKALEYVELLADVQFARYWRRLMLDEVITNHQRCLAELTVADTVGTLWKPRRNDIHPGHYSGNFWWARPSHIRRLPDIRGLQRSPRPFVDAPINARIQCEFWLTMARGRFAQVGYSGDPIEWGLWRWTTTVADIVNALLGSGGGRRFAELSMDGPSPYFDAVVADSKVSVSYAPPTDAGTAEQFLAAEAPLGGYNVILVDARYEPKHSLEVIERCMPKLADGGALVVHHSNPPTAWHQRPADDFAPGSDWNGQAWRAVIEFRIRHPQCEVFTVDTYWGCTVIRPSRQSRHEPGAASLDALDWAVFERDREALLNLVDVPWFHRYLYADPYLSGAAMLVIHTELLNVLVAVNGLDTYLEIGVGTGDNQSEIIAPIRQSVDPGAVDGGIATYQMTSDEFFTSGFGMDRYDLIFVDGLHEEEQCLRDLEHALARLSDRGWIVAHDANPPTEWHQRPADQYEPGTAWNGTVWKAVVRFRSEHPELEFFTLDFDWGCSVMRRRTGKVQPDTVLNLPNALDWAYFAEHRRELLDLTPASTEELRNLFCREDGVRVAPREPAPQPFGSDVATRRLQ